MAETTFAELVPEPAAGRVHPGEAWGGLSDTAPGGRVRLDALARWLQDVAYADVEDAGRDGLGLWIVRRTRLRVRRFPGFRERVALRTWCSGLGRVWAERMGRRRTPSRCGCSSTPRRPVRSRSRRS